MTSVYTLYQAECLVLSGLGADCACCCIDLAPRSPGREGKDPGHFTLQHSLRLNDNTCMVYLDWVGMLALKQMDLSQWTTSQIRNSMRLSNRMILRRLWGKRKWMITKGYCKWVKEEALLPWKFILEAPPQRRALPWEVSGWRDSTKIPFMQVWLQMIRVVTMRHKLSLLSWWFLPESWYLIEP